MSWREALVQVAGMFGVMVIGYVARRRELLPGPSIAALSRFVVDVALPALILDQMLAVDHTALLRGWLVPVWAVALTALAFVLGAVTAPAFSPPGARRTYVFLAGTANWIYMPLPLAGAFFGDEGRLVVLLYNVGGLLMLWSLGVWVLEGRADRASLRELWRNPGLIATAGGIGLALAHAGELASSPSAPVAMGFSAVRQILHLLGTLTVPLSLLFIGAQLGPTGSTASHERRAVAGVILVRLVLAPAATLVLVLLAVKLGLEVAPVTRATLTLITAMPVAVSCGVLTERYGGDAGLASRVIFASTLASLVATPALVAVLGKLP